MIKRKAVFALLLAAVTTGALACDRRKDGRDHDEADIRQRIDKWAEAIRAMDLEGVMSIYARDIVSFDIEPPLQHVGAEAKKKNWAKTFAMYERPRGYEIRDLTITVGDDVAFGHSTAFPADTDATASRGRPGGRARGSRSSEQPPPHYLRGPAARAPVALSAARAPGYPGFSTHTSSLRFKSAIAQSRSAICDPDTIGTCSASHRMARAVRR
jgi:ketosteroid isomerase-like protein